VNKHHGLSCGQKFFYCSPRQFLYHADILRYSHMVFVVVWVDDRITKYVCDRTSTTIVKVFGYICIRRRNFFGPITIHPKLGVFALIQAQRVFLSLIASSRIFQKFRNL
jgi:hypothetical protein